MTLAQQLKQASSKIYEGYAYVTLNSNALYSKALEVRTHREWGGEEWASSYEDFIWVKFPDSETILVPEGLWTIRHWASPEDQAVLRKYDLI